MMNNIIVRIAFTAIFTLSSFSGSLSGEMNINPRVISPGVDNNLSAGSRFNPPVLVSWNEETKSYDFYDHTDEFVGKFAFKSELAYLAAILGQFLKEQRDLSGRDIKVSDESLKERFEAFRYAITDKKRKGELFIPDMDYMQPEPRDSMHMENNSTIWVPCPTEDKDKFYYYCFYIDEKAGESVPGCVMALPVSDGPEEVVCQRIGPVERSYVNKDHTAIGTKPTVMYEVLKWSMLDEGSELSLIWQKDINTRGVIDFYKCIMQLESKQASIQAKKRYLDVMLINMVVSTLGMDSATLRAALVDFFSDGSPEKRRDALAAFHVEWQKWLTGSDKIENAVPGSLVKVSEFVVDKSLMESATRALAEIREGFAREGLSADWINSFSSTWKIISTPAKMEVIAKNRIKSSDPSLPQEETPEVRSQERDVVEKITKEIKELLDRAKVVLEDYTSMDKRAERFLYELEEEIDDHIFKLIQLGYEEETEAVSDAYMEMIDDPSIREKTKGLFPGPSVMATIAHHKEKLKKYQEAVKLYGRVAGTLSWQFKMVLTPLDTGITREILEKLENIEDRIEEMVVIVMRYGYLKDAERIGDEYIMTTSEPSVRKKLKGLYPGLTVLRAIAVVKSELGKHREAIELLEEAIDKARIHEKTRRTDTLIDFRYQTFIQIMEYNIKAGEFEKAISAYKRARREFDTMMSGYAGPKTVAPFKFFLFLLYSIRDVYLSIGDLKSVFSCTHEADKLVCSGNRSIFAGDNDKLVREYSDRVDLLMRMWDMSGSRDDVISSVEGYLKKLAEMDPGGREVILYDGWRAIKLGDMEKVKSVIYEIDRSEDIPGKKFVIFLRMCFYAAMYFKRQGDADSAAKISEIGARRLTDLTDMDKANPFFGIMTDVFGAIASGPEGALSEVEKKLASGKYTLEHKPQLMAYLFLKIAALEARGVIPEIHNAAGEIAEDYLLMIRLFDSDHRGIMENYGWAIEPYRDIFRTMARRLFEEERESLSLKNKLSILVFLSSTRNGSEHPAWIISRVLELKEGIQRADGGSASVKKMKKQKRQQEETDKSYLEFIDRMVAELKKEYSARDRFEEAKRYISLGRFELATQEVDAGIQKAQASGDDMAELELSIAADVISRIDEGSSLYSAQQFLAAREKYLEAMDYMREIEMTPPQALEDALKKAETMSESEEKYLVSRDSDAIAIAEKVHDETSRQFIGKIRRLCGIKLGDPACKSTMNELKREFPDDTRVSYVYEEYARALEKTQKKRREYKTKFLAFRKAVIELKGNQVDELTSQIRELVTLNGADKELRQEIAGAVRKYMRSEELFEASKLIEETEAVFTEHAIDMGNALADLKRAVSQTIKAQAEKFERELGDRVMKKAEDWLRVPAINIKKMKNIMSDLIRVHQYARFSDTAATLYVKMLKRAYDEGFYPDVIEHASAGMSVFNGKTCDLMRKLRWKAKARQIVARVTAHFHILDCQVKAEAFSIRGRLPDAYENDTLEYSFTSSEIVGEGYIKVKDIFVNLREPDGKVKKQQRSLFDAVKDGESYMMTAKNDKDEKVEVFLSVRRIEKEFIFFELPYIEERESIRKQSGLKEGTLVKISDPSLLRRRNLLGAYIANMESCITRELTPSTGHVLVDIALDADVVSPVEKPGSMAAFFDQEIARDASQKRTVEKCLDENLPFHLIQGPPGTGKTRVTVELIRQFYNMGKKVLVVSQSNPGIDNLGSKLLSLQKDGEDLKFARVGNEEKVIDEELRDNWSDRDEILKDMYESSQRIKGPKRGCVVLGTTNGFTSVMSKLTRKDMKTYYGSYDVVIVEEAGRATLAETVYPLSWAEDNGKVILVGDHMQLPAYGIDRQQIEDVYLQLVTNGYSEELIDSYLSPKKISEYRISLFERLWKKGRYFVTSVNKHTLSINRRSHWAIAKLVSSLFYDGKITPDPAKRNSPLEPDTVRVIDYAKNRMPPGGFETRSGTSYENMEEAFIVIKEVDRFLSQREDGKKRYSGKDITIITPYDSQRELIAGLLDSRAVINEIISGAIFTMPDDARSDRLERLETNINKYPGCSKPEVIRAMAVLRRGAKESERPQIQSVFRALPIVSEYAVAESFTWDDFEMIEVGNVDAIQGSENKVVILSLVRSNEQKDIGFLGTKDGLQRVNVAFSRAKEKFTVIADISNTIAEADPRDPRSGRWRYYVERSRDIFKRMLEIVDEMYEGYGKETYEPARKDIGGDKANNASVNGLIRKAIKEGKAVKLALGEEPYFYEPRYMYGFAPGIDDVKNVVAPLLDARQVERLRKYIGKAFADNTTYAGVIRPENVKVGIIKDSSYVSDDVEDKYSIAHAGEKTATIWFGELFLKAILEEDDAPDVQALFDHEIKHIADHEGALKDHDTKMFDELRENMYVRAEVIRQKRETDKMIRLISEQALCVAPGKKIIIGLDLSWAKNAQCLNILESALTKLSGKDNILILRSEGDSLAGLIDKNVPDADYSNVVILGPYATITSGSFAHMKLTQYEKRAFFAEIDPRELTSKLDPGVYNYIRLVEMINIALELAFRGDITVDSLNKMYPGVMVIKTVDPREYIFLPRCRQLDLKLLKDIYDAQAKVIISA